MSVRTSATMWFAVTVALSAGQGAWAQGAQGRARGPAKPVVITAPAVNRGIARSGATSTIGGPTARVNSLPVRPAALARRGATPIGAPRAGTARPVETRQAATRPVGAPKPTGDKKPGGLRR